MEQVWAVVEEDGTVSNTIVADDAFIAQLREHIADENIDTGIYHTKHEFADITKINPRPGIGWIRNGVAFDPPEPKIPEEV